MSKGSWETRRSIVIHLFFSAPFLQMPENVCFWLACMTYWKHHFRRMYLYIEPIMGFAGYVLQPSYIQVRYMYVTYDSLYSISLVTPGCTVYLVLLPTGQRIMYLLKVQVNVFQN